PGLIEDAHAGRGLGHQFLRHIERCRLLLFLADVTSEAPALDLEVVARELALHNPELAHKPSVIALTKADLLPPEQHAAAVARAAPTPCCRCWSRGYGSRASARRGCWAAWDSRPRCRRCCG